MAEHPAETLRRASSRLREAMTAATPPPWRVSFIEGVTPAVDGPNPDGHLVAELNDQCGEPGHVGRAKADAMLIVALRNSAGWLAAWLEAEANRADREVKGGPEVWWHKGDAFLGSACHCWDGALATARAILGETGAGPGEPP